MIKNLSLLILLSSLVFASVYPQKFSQLGTPLYKSKKPLIELSKNVKSIDECCKSYLVELEEVEKLGFKVDDAKDDVEIKKYLFKLRKLQHEHDYILHEIHDNINRSIDENNYIKFTKLIKYKFDGLLNPKSLYKKSLKYYKKNKHKHRISFFDEKMSFEKNLVSTSEEFNSIISRSIYIAKQKKKNRKSVYLEVKKKKGYLVVYATNTNPYVVTLKIKPRYENLNVENKTKNIFILKSKEKVEYARLYNKNKNKSNSYGFSYSWIIGSVDAKHDNTYIYALPYAKNKAFIVSQGFNGTVTHKGRSQYAIDFGMKEGTKVYSARDGVVVRTKEDSNIGGASKKFSSSGNYVTIQHNDFTLATYYHLKQYGVKVKVGQKVKRGHFIGLSGNTGYSTGPHLHFSVFKADSISRTKTIAIRFITKRGVIDNPIKGVAYIAK